MDKATGGISVTLLLAIALILFVVPSFGQINPIRTITCDDDTADQSMPLQTIFNDFNTLGYGQLTVIATGKLCYVAGAFRVVSGSIMGSAGTATVNVSTAIPMWVDVGAPATIFGENASGKTGINGTWLITNIGSGRTSFDISTTFSTTSSSSGLTVSFGPWTNAVVSIEGQCTTRFNTGQDCSGFQTYSSSDTTTEAPIFVISSVPLCTNCATQNVSAIRIRHLNFKATDMGTSAGRALGGVFVEFGNGFELSDNSFSGFVGTNTQVSDPSTKHVAAGAAITLDAGPVFDVSHPPFVQGGYIANNKVYDTKYGLTTRGQASSNTFLNNFITCSTSNASTVPAGSVGMDLGLVWNLREGNNSKAGGENTLLGNQVQNCEIGYAFDMHKLDNIVSKAEIDVSPTHTGGTVGFSVLNSQEMWLAPQSLMYNTGFHIDDSSRNIHVTGARITGASGSANITADSTSGYTSASNVVDTSARPTTTVSGLLDTLSLTTNAAFTADSFQVGVSVLEGNPTLSLLGSANWDALYADAGAHRWKMNNSNGGAVQVVGSGVDIDINDWVTSTHLSSPLPPSQGGVTNLATAKVGGIYLPMGLNLQVSAPTAQAASPSGANKVSVVQFVLPVHINVSRIGVNVATASSGKTVNAAIYDSGGNLLVDSGSFSCTAIGQKSNAITAVVLNPGVYYFAWAATDIVCGLSGFTANSVTEGLANQNSAVRFATAANSLSGPNMPATLGMLTPSSSINWVLGYIEP